MTIKYDRLRCAGAKVQRVSSDLPTSPVTIYGASNDVSVKGQTTSGKVSTGGNKAGLPNQL